MRLIAQCSFLAPWYDSKAAEDAGYAKLLINTRGPIMRGGGLNAGDR